MCGASPSNRSSIPKNPTKHVKDPIFNGNIPWYMSPPAEARQLRSRTQKRDGHTTTIAAWEKGDIAETPIQEQM
jgi:hypothetical protein